MDEGDYGALVFLYVLFGIPVIIFLIQRIKFIPVLKYIYCITTPAVAIALLVIGFKLIYAFSPELGEEIMNLDQPSERDSNAMHFLPPSSRALGYIPSFLSGEWVKHVLLFICPVIGLSAWYLLFYFINKYFVVSSKK